MSLGILRTEQSTSEVVLSAVIALPFSDSPVQVLPCSPRLRYILDRAGVVWSCHDERLEVLEVPFARKVLQLACSETAILLVTEDGEVYARGEDAEGSGVLGGPAQIGQLEPLQGLQQVAVSQAALSSRHGAALDSNSHTDTGQLWTWGSGSALGRSAVGPLPPAAVASAVIFTGKRVVCTSSLTGLLTTAGYLYLYGQTAEKQVLGKSPAHPRTLPELREKYISAVETDQTVVALLTDTGEVYCFDSGLEVVRLPTEAGTKASTVGCALQGVFAWAEQQQVLYVWQPAHANSPLFTWTAQLHSPLLPFAVVPSSPLCIFTSQALSASQPIATPLCSLSPYRHSLFVSSMVSRVKGRLERWQYLQDSSPLLPYQAGVIHLSDVMERSLKTYGMQVFSQIPAQVLEIRRAVRRLDAVTRRNLLRNYFQWWRIQKKTAFFVSHFVNSLHEIVQRRSFKRLFQCIRRHHTQITVLQALLKPTKKLLTVHFAHWKESVPRRRVCVALVGARALGRGLEMLLRERVWRAVTTALKHRQGFEAAALVLGLRLDKVQRRMTNWAFNRLYFRGRAYQVLCRTSRLFQGLLLTLLRPALCDLTRLPKRNYASSIFSFLSLSTRLRRKRLQMGWAGLQSSDSLYLGNWNSSQGSGGLGKASLRIPLSNGQSPKEEKGHRVSWSLKGPLRRVPQPVQTKPPWKRPSPGISFEQKSPLFSPRSRRQEYVKVLKAKRSLGLTQDSPLSLKGSRCGSPDLVQLDRDWSASQRYAKPDSAATTDASLQLSAETSLGAQRLSSQEQRCDDLEREWCQRVIHAGASRLERAVTAIILRTLRAPCPSK